MAISKSGASDLIAIVIMVITTTQNIKMVPKSKMAVNTKIHLKKSIENFSFGRQL